MNTTLQYIYHDCFIWRSDVCTCIFDFWKDPAGNERFLQEIDSSKPLYIFVSHHHKDHFVRDIFRWKKYFRSIRFVLSYDTAKAVRYLLKEDGTYKGELNTPKELVTILSPGDTFEDENISVSAFGSTDTGCSYFVNINGVSLFHAGDLNAWVWKDESTIEEVNQEIAKFNKIVDDIVCRSPHINIALFPVDPRLGTDFWTGAYIFVRRINVDSFVPMHFCLGADREECIKFIDGATDFSAYANPEDGHYYALTSPYERAKLHFFK